MMTMDGPLVEGKGMLLGTGISRRGLFRVGTAFVATLAAMSTPKEALANGFCSGCGPSCCCLKYCNTCGVLPCGGWGCPPGYVDSFWTCQQGGRTCTCGECTQPGNDCFTGPWGGCSYGFCN